MIQSRVIAIANQKGGVGKTTTTISLGAVLADHGRKTLVLDLDPQAHATIGLGFQKNHITESIVDVILDDKAIESIILETRQKNLFIAPSNTDAVGMEIALIDVKQRELILRKKLETIKDQYDYILIDCPPSLGLLTINGLAASDSVIIPTQCEFLAMEGLVQLLNTIRQISDSIGIRILIEGIVLTMHDARTKLSREVETEIRGYFEGRIRVFRAVIPRNIRLSEAPSHGIPITVYAKNTPGAWCYVSLGEELMGID